jgi:AmmeMemoRadiSam system protein B
MIDLANVRPAVVAGMFYPSSPQELRSEVEKLLQQVKPYAIRGTVKALIVPHAGYIYSGLTAAHGFALLKSQPVETVVLVGPSHREYFPGMSVFSGSGFRTPLGTVEVDADLRDELLREAAHLKSSTEGHRTEHSLEVQLPFLQSVLQEFRILPIVMGDQHREFCLELGTALGKVLQKKNAILVASSDLSHYYNAAMARQLDAVAIKSIHKLDADCFLHDMEKEKTEACGGGPVAAVMHAARLLGADQCTVLHSCNSGDVSGDNDRVVGYVSAALWMEN